MAHETASVRIISGDSARFVPVGVLVLYAAIALLAVSLVAAAQLTGAIVLFAVGLILIQETERGRWRELGMDAALVAVAAAVMLLRWAPGIYAADVDAAGVVLLLIAPVAAFCGALFMVVLFAGPPATLPQKTAYALAAATVSLAVSALPQVMRGEPCCAAGSSATLSVVALWVFLIFAAITSLRARSAAVLVPQGERLRQFVAPTVAIILAAISIDISLHPPIERRIGVALGVLAVLVALRLTQLLQATHAQVAERRELAHTRALIEVSRALNGTNDLDATLRTVTEWAQRVLSARAAAIELVSTETQQLVIRATTGLPQSIVGWTYPLNGSFTGWVVQNGEIRVTPNAAQDELVSDHTRAIVGRAPLAAVPLRHRDRILGVLTCIGSRTFDSTDLELLRAFANQAATAIEDARLFDQVRTLSMTDPLTGLANRRRLELDLQREFAAARRGRRLAAVMFDLDEFKQHNDRHGHLAGDRALKHFGEALALSTRASNLAARFGGDEFLALLADADTRGAEIFVARVRARYEEIMRAAGHPVLNVSAGIAEFRPDMDAAVELIAAADRALYSAKSEAATSR
jgi:diguanylate cyclase (GGDEF)-like protein